MAKFDEIRKIMREFKQDIDGLANRKIEEMDTAKARLNPTALQEELVSLNIEYKQHFDFTRNMYREKLADAVADRRKGNANKYITGYIDYDLLNKMNIISQSGVELTEPELADFCKAAMKSRSEFCVRKCQLLAKENHYKLNVPSEAKANSVLDEVAKIAGEVIGGYTGALTGRDRGDGSDGRSMTLKVNSSGIFLNRYEKMYEKETIEDIQISRMSQKNFAKLNAEEQKKKEQEPVEIVNTDHVNISAKSDDSKSPAAQYVKGLSQKMATRTE